MKKNFDCTSVFGPQTFTAQHAKINQMLLSFVKSAEEQKNVLLLLFANEGVLGVDVVNCATFWADFYSRRAH